MQVAKIQLTNKDGLRECNEGFKMLLPRCLPAFGIFRLGEIAYDEALNISKSLNIAIENKTSGYDPNARFIGYNTQHGAARLTARANEADLGFQAPLVRKGAKLRLARPEERHSKRLASPQTEWDLLCGVIMAYREGDIPVARAYLEQHAENRRALVLDLVGVWAAEVADEALRKEAGSILFGLK